MHIPDAILDWDNTTLRQCLQFVPSPGPDGTTQQPRRCLRSRGDGGQMTQTVDEGPRLCMWP